MSATVYRVRDLQNGRVTNVAEERETASVSTAPEGEASWTNIHPDALAEIFSRLPFEDRIWTVPLVCKVWRDVSSYPACWKHLDMRGWFQKKAENDYLWEFESESTVERVVIHAVDKSCGLLTNLRTFHCSDKAIEYIADRCPSLTVLAIPNSHHITDESITKLASKCPDLQELDLSDCYNISDQTLEAVGRHCQSLVWLGRNMLQRQNELIPSTGPVPGGDEEAIVVAKHMVKLKHLEMKRTSLSDRGLAHLARGCRELQSLNLACCGELSPRALARVVEKCPNIVDFTQPVTPRMHVDSQRLRILFG